jgi:hypothetical protein
MGWIDDAEKHQQALAKRNAEIEQHATAIYESLWKEVKKDVDEMRRKAERFAGLITNGQELARSISYPPSNRFPWSVTISLFKERHQIQASGITPPKKVTFSIDVCADGFVCIKLDGDRVSPERASQVILYAFFYPELELPTEASAQGDRFSFPEGIKIPHVSV